MVIHGRMQPSVYDFDPSLAPHYPGYLSWLVEPNDDAAHFPSGLKKGIANRNILLYNTGYNKSLLYNNSVSAAFYAPLASTIFVLCWTEALPDDRRTPFFRSFFTLYRQTL